MSDHWEYFPCAMGDDTAFIFYDHGAREQIGAFPVGRVGLRLALKSPNERGLPTDQEFPLLSQVDDEVHNFAREHGGHYIGRVTVAGARHYTLYADVQEHAVATLCNRLTRDTGYELEFFLEDDPEHRGYWEDLFPTDRDWQVVQDLHVIESLEKHGDPCTTPRRIDHWAYFPHAEEANTFAQWASAAGYTVVERLSPEEDRPTYGVQLFHVARPQIGELSHHTIALLEAAKERGGEYDGWETSIEKKAAAPA